MNKHCKRWTLLGMILMIAGSVTAEDITLKITKKYLNIPVSHQQDRQRMSFGVNGKEERNFVIRLAPSTPDYWVFCDVSALKGKKLTISYPGENTGLSRIYQDDIIAGQDSLYEETNRPLIHFTQKRGWNNDPNGLIYYEGEYHLFYQHNPYERDWENMHWGHAVSKDLVHWEELPEALFPDALGTAFSGSAVIDYENVSGFGEKGKPAMVAFYTAASPDKQVQCVAYSLDKGRTWTKYQGNPVIDSKAIWKSTDTRDPKVFRYEPTGDWIMALNERDGHSIYTSQNLKDWTYQSHTTGFWECPELFELPVDGDPQNTKWVMYGASGTYMLGSFDGKKFTSEFGKFSNTSGAIYAAQTFNNMPKSDGRRIQIGWQRVSHPGMPFNGSMTLPAELTLRTTPNGIRMSATPVKELEKLELPGAEGRSLTMDQANELLKPFAGEGALRIRATIKLSHATSAGISLFGQNLIDYDMNSNLINGRFYSPDDMTSMEITADILVDKTSFEVYIDNGAYYYTMERRPHRDNKDGFRFWGNNVEIKTLNINHMKSIWE